MYAYKKGGGNGKFLEDPDLRGGHPGVSGCTVLDYNRFFCFKPWFGYICLIFNMVLPCPAEQCYVEHKSCNLPDK